MTDLLFGFDVLPKPQSVRIRLKKKIDAVPTPAGTMTAEMLYSYSTVSFSLTERILDTELGLNAVVTTVALSSTI